MNYEQEEECLTNDLSRKLNQVGHAIDLVGTVESGFIGDFIFRVYFEIS